MAWGGAGGVAEWCGVVRRGVVVVWVLEGRGLSDADGKERTMSFPIPATPLTALPASSAPLASGISLAATRFVCSDCLLIVYGQGPCSPSELCFS